MHRLTLHGVNRNPDLDGPFTPNVLNSVVFLLTLTMQVSTFAVNYQVRQSCERPSPNARRALQVPCIIAGV